MIRHVRDGTFDVVLLRPLSVLGQLAAADLQLRRLGRVSVSLVLLVVVLVRLDLDWTPARVAMAVVAPIAATVVFGALFVAAGGVAFWVVDATEVTSALTYGSAYLAQWPTGVLTPVLARFFTFVIPAAFTGYLPALALLGMPDPTGLPGWLPWASPAGRGRRRGRRRAGVAVGNPALRGSRRMSERDTVVDIENLSRHFVVRRPAGRLRREKRVVRAVDGIRFTVAAGASASATSARTAPASRRRSRC